MKAFWWGKQTLVQKIVWVIGLAGTNYACAADVSQLSEDEQLARAIEESVFTHALEESREFYRQEQARRQEKALKDLASLGRSLSALKGKRPDSGVFIEATKKRKFAGEPDLLSWLTEEGTMQSFATIGIDDSIALLEPLLKPLLKEQDAFMAALNVQKKGLAGERYDLLAGLINRVSMAFDRLQAANYRESFEYPGSPLFTPRQIQYEQQQPVGTPTESYKRVDAKMWRIEGLGLKNCIPLQLMANQQFGLTCGVHPLFNACALDEYIKSLNRSHTPITERTLINDAGKIKALAGLLEQMYWAAIYDLAVMNLPEYRDAIETLRRHGHQDAREEALAAIRSRDEEFDPEQIVVMMHELQELLTQQSGKFFQSPLFVLGPIAGMGGKNLLNSLSFDVAYAQAKIFSSRSLDGEDLLRATLRECFALRYSPVYHFVINASGGHWQLVSLVKGALDQWFMIVQDSMNGSVDAGSSLADYMKLLDEVLGQVHQVPVAGPAPAPAKSAAAPTPVTRPAAPATPTVPPTTGKAAGPASAAAPSAAAPTLPTSALSPEAKQALHKFIEVVKADMVSISRVSSIDAKLAIGSYGGAWEEFKKFSVSFSQDLKDRIEILRGRFLTAMAHFMETNDAAELDKVLADFGNLA